MKRVYLITLVILMTFSVSSKGHGAVSLYYHDRAVSAWADPDYEWEYYDSLYPAFWDISVNAVGNDSNAASAWQRSTINYIYHTEIIVFAEGEASKFGNNTEASSYVMVDFTIDQVSMVEIDYSLTGGGYIELYKDWTWDELVLPPFSGTGLYIGALDPGTSTIYRLAVGSIDNGSYFMDFTVSVLPLCTGNSDLDGDVDGSDLAAFVVNPGGVILADFAAHFGRSDCPLP